MQIEQAVSHPNFFSKTPPKTRLMLILNLSTSCFKDVAASQVERLQKELKEIELAEDRDVGQ